MNRVTSLVHELPLVNEWFTSLVRFPVYSQLFIHTPSFGARSARKTARWPISLLVRDSVSRWHRICSVAMENKEAVVRETCEAGASAELHNVHWHTTYEFGGNSLHIMPLHFNGGAYKTYAGSSRFINASAPYVERGCGIKSAGSGHGRAYVDALVAICALDQVHVVGDASTLPSTTPSARSHLLSHGRPAGGVVDGASPIRAPGNNASVAMCISPVYGSLPVWMVSRHLEHHRRLGISWMFLYVDGSSSGRIWAQDALPQLRHEPRLCLLQLPWTSEVRTWQRAQVWQINDCLHRAASRSIEWVLSSFDLDEYLRLPPSVPDLATFLHREGAAVDVIKLRSYPANATQHFPHNDGIMRLHGIHLGPETPTHRKHLVRAARLWVVHTHVVLNQDCRDGLRPARCRVLNRSASASASGREPFIAHYVGGRWDGNRTDGSLEPSLFDTEAQRAAERQIFLRKAGGTRSSRQPAGPFHTKVPLQCGRSGARALDRTMPVRRRQRCHRTPCISTGCTGPCHGLGAANPPVSGTLIPDTFLPTAARKVSFEGKIPIPLQSIRGVW